MNPNLITSPSAPVTARPVTADELTLDFPLWLLLGA
jgi:hypothetical protein